MESIQIVANEIYLPKKEITNVELAEKFHISCQSIEEKTGIQKRHYVQEEKIEELAIQATKKLISSTNFKKNKIEMIVVASTSTNHLMPGISYLVQKELEIETCMCLDILAGCNGYVNAFDIARSYIALGKIQYALVIGCEVLSNYTDQEDINTALLLSDGAGVTLIEKAKEDKKYFSLMESKGEKGEILTCDSNTKIYMDGKAIYKYAVTDTVNNIKKILELADEKIENIAYIVPHQSNLRILQKIAQRLEIPMEKMYINIEQIGNTFCASIPIALNEMFKKGLLQPKDKIILLGYGGGLNLGSILMEV